MNKTQQTLNAPQNFSMPATGHSEDVIVGAANISIEDVLAVAAGRAGVRLSPSPAFRQRIEAGAEFLRELVAAGEEIYGVNTGFGDSCTVPVPPELVAELPRQLTRYHGCGMGAWLDPAATRAVLAARLVSLARGYSGVRFVLLEQLAALINDDLLPLIPSEGSVGASGDLTPLSYVAAALIGEREVLHRGERRSAAAALAAVGRSALLLAPKEGLAVMNGTAVMTGLACLAFGRAEYLTRLACRLTSLAAYALQTDRDHFDPHLFAVKPHAGQAQCAAWIHGDLAGSNPASGRLQQRYSIRCAPHVIGVARDALDWVRRDVENELNSANDNPLVDAERRRVMHGGHFYGGHIAFAMDALKLAVANLADLMDRQLALLVDPRYNEGLPQNLSGASPGARAAINHGFKAVQIGVSAWTAEALKLTMPASAFSRSTECHNQDKVSMGTIAARDCLRILELTEQVAAAHLLAVVQAATLRGREHGNRLPSALAAFQADLGEFAIFLAEDRPLEGELRHAAAAIARRAWTLY